MYQSLVAPSRKAPEWLTTPSPQNSKVPVKRAWLTVNVPSLPPPEAGVGGARDINKDVYGWVLYGGTNPSNATMWRQTSPTGDPTTTSEADIVTGLTLSGTNPITSTQGFPALSPAKIISSTSNAGIPLLSLDGDGNAVFNNMTTKGLTTTEAQQINGRMILKHIATPTDPAAGNLSGPYAKSDNNLYIKAISATETKILTALQGEWVTFTPNMPNVPMTVVYAKYRRLGNTVDVKMIVTLTAGIGAALIDLPFTFATGTILAEYNKIGEVNALRTGVAWHVGKIAPQQLSGPSRAAIYVPTGAGGQWNATVPVTWANTDPWSIELTYECAP